jgi:hypothetical protein
MYPSAASFVILVERPHIVHVVIYLLAMGMIGTKNTEKNVRVRMTVCAAGEWQSPQRAKILVRRYCFRLIPKMTSITRPFLDPSCVQKGRSVHPRRAPGTASAWRALHDSAGRRACSGASTPAW